jgi:hypothetical protein
MSHAAPSPFARLSGWLLRLLAVLGIALPPAMASAGPDGTELSIGQVHEAVVRTALLEPERSRSLLARARRAALLPRLRVSVSRELRRYDSYLETPDPRTNAGADLLFEVSATWSLDRLVFHPGEVAAARQALRAARARRELLEVSTRLYYSRRRLLLELAATPVGPARLELQLRLEEATALLEALMGQKLARTRGRD